jgi:hypothetical protein
MLIEIEESWRNPTVEEQNEAVEHFIKERQAFRIRYAARYLHTHGRSRAEIAHQLGILLEEVKPLLIPEDEYEQENGYRVQCAAIPNGNFLPPDREE